MTLGGYENRVAHIDLTTGDIEYKGIPQEWAEKYIGARGLGVRYVFENGPEVDPLSPDNLLCFMNGPLTGSAASMSGRQAVVTKSPLTGTVTDAHQGGWSAARMRWAGFDGIAIKGKSNKPVYLYLENGNVEIRDASEVWGKGCHDTIAHFKDKYGEKDLTVNTIGQAGENLVRYSAWMNEDDRAAGRGGTGCVGGSKNLKAVVIKAKKVFPEPVDPDTFKPARQRGLKTIMDPKNITAPRKGGLSVYGTNVLMNIANVMGALPTFNGQVTQYEHADKIGGEYVKDNILVNDPTCHACPVACKKEVEIKEGEFAGLKMESVEYEPAWCLGANCGNDNIESIAYMIDMANDRGLDAIEIGDILGCYMEATDKGYAAEKGDEGLKWGDYKAMIATIEKVVSREGIGDVLANGLVPTADHFGHPEIAMHCKGQGVPAYDPRGMKGMGVAYATSNRGACHLRAYTPASETGVIPLRTKPLDWKGKGELTKLMQDLHAFSDSMDLCKFSAFAMGADEYAQQYAGMTGRAFTADDVLAAGERIYNLERHFNNKAGFGPGSDVLPERYSKEPSTMGGSEGHVCEIDEMLAEYYAARGWDNGVVPESKLAELGVT
ncbi:MAG: aldehyde ferredoxin oxidoreductase family protein [Planctomycetota bacterium]|jgi:aldehyde:ferredoxin oxidoreductase